MTRELTFGLSHRFTNPSQDNNTTLTTKGLIRNTVILSRLDEKMRNVVCQNVHVFLDPNQYQTNVLQDSY